MEAPDPGSPTRHPACFLGDGVDLFLSDRFQVEALQIRAVEPQDGAFLISLDGWDLPSIRVSQGGHETIKGIARIGDLQWQRGGRLSQR